MSERQIQIILVSVVLIATALLLSYCPLMVTP